MSANKYISIINKGGENLLIKDSEAREALSGISTVWDSMTYTDVYIGKGVNYSSAMTSTNHHDVVVKGDHVSLTCNNSKVWIILKDTNNTPLLMMSGTEIPLTAGSDVTQDGVTYKVFSSTNTYTGTFNAIVF